ncbi:MAG: hypothetical protein KAG99_10785 [Bacteroidales bacterium]|nr:hypothetical protein [Bacteroidales bacterium]
MKTFFLNSINYYSLSKTSGNEKPDTIIYASFSLRVNSTSPDNPPSGEMKVGQVLGDATSGILYNWGWNKLWVSFDYGKS